MAAARPCMTGWACTWRYLYISSERHRPSNRMRSASTPAQSRAMAPPARVERMETSATMKAGSGYKARA